MTDHPHELLPAFVLEALNDEERRHVAQHLLNCSACQAEAASFRTVVDLLPYEPPTRPLPAHIKRQLFARINATCKQDETQAVPPNPVISRHSYRAVFKQIALVLIIGLVFILGGMMVNAERRITGAETALQQSEQQLSEQQEIVTFISAPNTAMLALAAPQRGVAGKIMMHSGAHYMVLVVRGLPPPPAQHVYQFWFATTQQPVPSRLFITRKDGSADLLINAPKPVDQYEQVMVTIEPEGGSATPSEQVVLSAAL